MKAAVVAWSCILEPLFTMIKGSRALEFCILGRDPRSLALRDVRLLKHGLSQGDSLDPNEQSLSLHVAIANFPYA